MKKKGSFRAWMTHCGFFLWGIFSLLLTSCAVDGFDDETYKANVGDGELTSPAEEDITITASPTGTTQVISWPFSMGAGGYEVNVYDVTDPNNVVTIFSDVVDGTWVTVAREEDTDYLVTILTKGNTSIGKSDAATTTSKKFTTFTEAFAEIPDGTDLGVYFEENPVPDDSGMEEFCYDLVAGGHYTMSKSIEFGHHRVLLRGKGKNADNIAQLTVSDGASFLISSGLVLRQISIDCSASSSSLMLGSKAPDESTKGATGTGDFYMIGYVKDGTIVASPVTIQGCKIEGVNGYLYYDNDTKYCIKDFTIDNSVIHFTSSTDNISAGAYIYFKQGYINDIVVQNSTFWNSGSKHAKYFTQYANNQRGQRSGLGNTTVTYTNNTFYNIAVGSQWANYSGLSGQATTYITVKNNIWVNCSTSGQIARRINGGNNNNINRAYSYNTYYLDGEDTSAGESSYDNGVILTSDPGFANPDNGDFTISGVDQIGKRTGDPRWLP